VVHEKCLGKGSYPIDVGEGGDEKTTGVTSVPHKLECVAEAGAPWVKATPFGLSVVL